MYIIVLMTGALLSVNRVHLIKTLKRCGPVFLAAAVCATGFGLLGGKMVGMSMGETLSYFILPNLGGGNGAGAVPMADIFNQITGTPAKDYYAKALAILTLGSTIALIFGVVLNRIGQMIPGLAGDGKTLLRDSTKETKLEGAGEVEYEPSRLDIANAFLVAASFYTVANILGKWLLPNIGGVIIHPLAYLIVLLTLANVFNIVPENLQAASNVLGDFVVEKMAPFCFAGLGIAVTDFSEFVAAITFQNFFVCFMIILGVVIGSGIIAQLVGFYPIDAIIAAGLTCSNRGDSADVILLSATGRMGLMPYAQVMSRLGGAVILALSSVVFTIFYA
ncbi:MAG: 2-hydroxycarboxylate transporter family protein, partial [Oscillospiraceae bacterium]